MRRSKAEVYLHLVWATRGREPMVVPRLQEAIYSVITSIAERLGCEVLAVGGMPDHLHMVVRLLRKTSISQLVQQVKGASSHRANELLGTKKNFRWQEGYGVFSLSRSHLLKVIAYVQWQEEHHCSGRLWAEWEETDEPDD
jgi:putative transposase